MQTNKIRDEKMDITRDTKEIQKILRTFKICTLPNEKT